MTAIALLLAIMPFSVSVLERRFTMLAIKKLNNNAVLCRDGQGRDVIAMGRGVGFGGDFPRELPLSKIEHTFYDIDPKGQDLMRDLPSDIVMFAAKVMDIVANELPYDLSTNATLFMADHLSFAVARAQKGVRIAMPLAYEVRETYPKEYKAAQFIVMRLEKELGERLPKDEIASIAMNLVNARVVEAVKATASPQSSSTICSRTLSRFSKAISALLSTAIPLISPASPRICGTCSSAFKPASR